MRKRHFLAAAAVLAVCMALLSAPVTAFATGPGDDYGDIEDEGQEPGEQRKQGKQLRRLIHPEFGRWQLRYGRFLGQQPGIPRHFAGDFKSRFFSECL